MLGDHTEGSEIKALCPTVQQSVLALKFLCINKLKRSLKRVWFLCILLDLHNERKVVHWWQLEDHFCLTNKRYKENKYFLAKRKWFTIHILLHLAP